MFRGAGTGPALVDVMQFGGPVAVPLSLGDVHDDPDLATFLAKEAGAARYALVHSGVSLQPGDAAAGLTSAAVQMTLGSDGGAATAWSLAPMSAATPNETTSSFSLGPDAKILGADVRIATIGRTQTRRGEDVFLQAKGLLTSEPGWEFTRTPTRSLAGSYRLVLVVRAPAHHQARLMVTLSASIKTGPWPRRFRKTLALQAAGDPAAIIF
jgi:hypothetical protein